MNQLSTKVETFKSNVAEHAHNNKSKKFHNINFENPNIIYSEKTYSSRIILESVAIEKAKIANKPLMNDHQNSKNKIPQAYFSLF